MLRLSEIHLTTWVSAAHRHVRGATATRLRYRPVDPLREHLHHMVASRSALTPTAQQQTLVMVPPTVGLPTDLRGTTPARSLTRRGCGGRVVTLASLHRNLEGVWPAFVTGSWSAPSREQSPSSPYLKRQRTAAVLGKHREVLRNRCACSKAGGRQHNDFGFDLREQHAVRRL